MYIHPLLVWGQYGEVVVQLQFVDCGLVEGLEDTTVFSSVFYVLSIFTILFNNAFLFSCDVYTNDNFYTTGTSRSSKWL
jgi:hypothetical protein